MFVFPPIADGDIVISGIVLIVTIFILYFVFKIFDSPKLPPFCPSTAYENVKSQTSQQGLSRLNHLMEQSLIMYRRAATGKGGTKYGTVWRMRKWSPFASGNIYCTDYRLARTVLLGDKDRSIQESIKKKTLSTFNFADRNVSNLFTASSLDPVRAHARKFIAPSFSTSNLLPSAQCLDENIENIFHIFDTYISSGEIIDMKEMCLSIFIETLTQASFDITFSSGDSTDSTAVSPTGRLEVNGKLFLQELDIALRERSLQSFLPLRKYMFWNKAQRRSEQACAKMKEIAEQVLTMSRDRARSKHCIDASMDTANQTEQASSEGSKVKSVGGDGAEPNGEALNGSILHRILEHDYPSDAHRVSEIISFIVAGHETSAFTLCFFLFEMARNPGELKKVQHELDEVITAETCPNGRPTLAQVSKCENLLHCLKESMRLWPVAGSGSARTLLQDIEYEGYILPKGAVVQTVFYAIFRQPWIDRPNDFVPDRWADTSPQSKDLKDMLMPFSLGKRNCIGQNMAMMQLKILAANFMRYYEFELAEEVKFEHFLTVKPESLRMRIRRRS